eukprot:3879362-Prymnesium_polylepis.1
MCIRDRGGAAVVCALHTIGKARARQAVAHELDDVLTEHTDGTRTHASQWELESTSWCVHASGGFIHKII